jgi:transposase-like protein
VKKLREGIASFFQDRRRGRPTVLKTEVSQRAQQLLDEGKSVPEVGRELGVKFNPLHKAIRQGRLQQRTGGTPLQVAAVSTKSERSETDSIAPMGNAATRSLKRVAAAMGALESAPVEFEAACDVAGGGVLLALMALARIRSMEQLRSPRCRGIMWRASGYACAALPITGSMPWMASPSSLSIRPCSTASLWCSIGRLTARSFSGR